MWKKSFAIQYQCERCSINYRYVYTYFTPNDVPGKTIQEECDNPVNGIAQRQDTRNCDSCNDPSLPLPPVNIISDAWTCGCGDWVAVSGNTNYCCGYEQNNNSSTCSNQSPDKYGGTSHDSCFNFSTGSSPAVCQKTTSSSRCCYKAEQTPYSGTFARCSDIYKYCYASWSTDSSGLDTPKTSYVSDCSCNASIVNGTRSECAWSSCAPPTVTNPPADCGTSCANNPAACTNARNNCTFCNSSGTCAVPPVTSPPVDCGSPCSNQQACSTARNNCTVCSSNGTCSAPTVTNPPADCGTSCANNPAACTNARNNCTFCNSSGTCAVPPVTSPPVDCGSPCSNQQACSTARNNCTVCSSNGTCSAPTVTNPPADCGTSCANNPAACTNARNNCTFCNSSGTCAVPPACGTTCARSSDCTAARDGCTDCNSKGQCAKPFNTASCTCDGITATGLISGQKAVITSSSKIVGGETTNAKVVSELFKMYTVEGVRGSRVLEESVIATSKGSGKYETKWEFTFPQIEKGKTYRIWSDINCQPKTVAVNYSLLPRMVVLGSAVKASALDNIFGFFDNFWNLFRSSPKKETTTSNSAETPVKSKGNDTIQLDPVVPAKVTQEIKNGCATLIIRQD